LRSRVVLEVTIYAKNNPVPKLVRVYSGAIYNRVQLGFAESLH
jgi:hypothetical protein